MNRGLQLYFKKHIWYGNMYPMHRSSSTQSTCRPTIMTQTNGVREIILNEPKSRNSLSLQMMESIKNDMTIDVNDDLRCIVLSSTGRIFSAGHNLNELSTGNCDQQLKVFQKLTEIIMCMYKAPVPVIAKVNGPVFAAGVQLVSSCDMIVCSEKSTFSTPGASVGIFCSTPGIAISRLMSRQKSLHMLLTGLPINAKDAFIAGLVSSVVSEEQLETEMLKIIEAIKSKSRAVIAFGKQFYYKQLNMNISDAYNEGAKKMTENLSLPDGKEGLNSFVEKRKPLWSHKC